MIKDPSARYNAGFGIQYPDVSKDNQQEGVAPDSSFIAKALHGHPVMKFITESTATLIGMEVASALVKRGGVKIGESLLKGALEGKQWHQNVLQDFRKTQSVFDRLQGLERTRGRVGGADAIEQAILDRKGGFNELIGDPMADSNVQERAGYFITREERIKAQQTGELEPAQWLLRDELQQRLVRQARRLPYDLPALYITQRGLTDRVFGNKDNAPNWKNPVDVIGDFASQSMKNTFGLLLPFEAAKGTGSNAYGRFRDAAHMTERSMADASTFVGKLQRNVAARSVNFNKTLGLVGHDVSQILGKGVQRTEQFTGALHMAIHEGAGKSKSTLEKADTVVRNVRERGISSIWREPDPRNLPGYIGDVYSFGKTFKKTWNQIGEHQAARTHIQSFGDSPFEDIAYLLHDLASGLTGNAGNEQMIAEYKQMLFDQFGKVEGLSRKEVTEFVHQIRVKSTPSKGVLRQARRPETFMEWGAGPWAQNEAPFSLHLQRRLTGAKNIEHPDIIAENFQRVTQQVERRFASQEKTIKARVTSDLRGARIEVLRRGPGVLGEARPAYKLFEGPVTPQAHEYLQRQTARALGIPLEETQGRTGMDMVRSRLRERGIDPDDIHSMRGFLVQNKKIAKPWSPGGFNIFGLRKLSVESALGKGYFGPRSEMMQKTLQDLEETHSFQSQMRRTPLRGVYETQGGNVLDLGVFRRKFWRGADLVANEAQVPYIHFRPLQAVGWQTLRSMRQSPAITLRSGVGKQPFLNVEGGKFTDSYVWTRQKGLKGTVSRVRHGAVTDIEGLYRQLPTDESTFVGRTVRQATGDLGRAPGQRVESQTGWRGALKRAFKIDEDQPDSFFRLAGRAWRHKQDPRNMMAFAGMLEKGEFPHGMAAGTPGFEKVLRGGSMFLNRLRQFGVPSRVIEALSENPKYKKLFTYQLRSGKILDFEQAQDAGTMRDMLQEMLADEAGGALDHPSISQATRKALESQRRRIESELDPRKLAGLEAPVSSNVMSPTIHRRIDQFRREIYQYLQIRQGLLEGGSVERMDTFFSDLLGEVDKLKRTGRLTRSESTEFRAALMSTQVTFEGVQIMRPELSPEDILRHQLSRLSGVDLRAKVPPARSPLLPEVTPGHVPKFPELPDVLGQMSTAKEVLPEIAAGAGGSPWRVGARKIFGGIAPYEYPGTRYDPFGGDTAFVPTFGTAFKRAPLRATASALGWKTWGDTEAFSGAGIPVSHGFTRLNRYFSGIGLGLDTTQFNGPLDLYARGMIGRRVLPVVAGGATALAMDRTIGGFVNKKDERGKRVYSPFFMGMGADVVEKAQVAAADIIPGGETGSEKDYELKHGEVAVRKGRWWPLGNQPWKGGNEQYFRPSWYRRLKSGYMYQDQTYGTPAERLAFGYDFSPLRPLDPYRFERKHYQDRPYPVSGEYFTGPWGPITPALNMTLGRILKPRIMMHKDELAANMAGYTAVGESGMAPPNMGFVSTGGMFGLGGTMEGVPIGGGMTGGSGAGGGGGGGGGPGAFATGRPNTLAGHTGGTGGTFGSGGQGGGGLTRAGYDARSMLQGYNDRYMQWAGSTGSASRATQGKLGDINTRYMAAASGYSKAGGRLPVRVPFGMVMAAPPASPGEYQVGELGYNLQETLGIYGFAFASARGALGLGEKDFIPPTPTLASPGTAYGTGRTFWDFNLGGLGDSPLPVEGEYSNLEFGEVIRRFVPKPRRMNVVNPLVNEMATKYPWLPASFKTGDPFTSIPEGEMRLPGAGYERTHPLAAKGEYGPALQFSILGDVAPWSDEFRAMERTIDYMPMTYPEKMEVEQTKKQAEAVRTRFNFTPYKYADTNPLDAGLTGPKFAAAKFVEKVRHSDNYFTRKFIGQQTATEDWERNNVYGQTFPQWENPIQDYLKPMVYRAANRTALGAAAGLSITAGMMWRTPKTRRIARFVGGAAGLAIGAGVATTAMAVAPAAAIYGPMKLAEKALGAEIIPKAYKFPAAVGLGVVGAIAGTVRKSRQTHEIGKRWMPRRRKEELAIEENSDILSYVKWKRLYEQAQRSGDGYMAANFRRQLQNTMYGADLLDSTPEQLAQAVPKRKREHFLSMLRAPESEHARILSTAPRLERRLYEAQWGMKVEKRPELADYFQGHELPAQEWEGWNPATDMEMVKLKTIQSQGLDAAQMGYYPQQIQQANLINLSYPQYRKGSQREDVQGQLQTLMSGSGMSGNVVKRFTPFPGVHLNMQLGG